MRWEYLLLGTDKAPLSVAEEEDDAMNDDDNDDVENLVGLRGVGLGGGMGLPTLSCFRPTWPMSPPQVCVFWRGGMGQRDRV